MEWMILPLKRYGVFDGRSGRREFWMYTLMLTVIWAAVYAWLFASLAPFDRPATAPYPTSFLMWLLVIGLLYWATFLPSLAVQVRRLHDQDKSGWLVLLAFIPYLGWLVMLALMCIEGTRGPNRFGPDPKDPDATSYQPWPPAGPRHPAEVLHRRPDLP